MWFKKNFILYEPIFYQYTLHVLPKKFLFQSSSRCSQASPCYPLANLIARLNVSYILDSLLIYIFLIIFPPKENLVLSSYILYYITCWDNIWFSNSLILINHEVLLTDLPKIFFKISMATLKSAWKSASHLYYPNTLHRCSDFILNHSYKSSNFFFENAYQRTFKSQLIMWLIKLVFVWKKQTHNSVTPLLANNVTFYRKPT